MQRESLLQESKKSIKFLGQKKCTYLDVRNILKFLRLISQSVFNKGGPRGYFCSDSNDKMDDKIVGTVMVESSQMSAFTALADELGVTITFEKPIKFEDLGLAELEKGQFQCLMCRYEFLYVVLVFLAR